MAAQTELYELVASLSAQEKRYFQITSDLHGAPNEKNYWQLFEAIEEQVKAGKGYDEAEIKRKFEGTNLGKNLAQIKNQLKSILYEMLVQFHRNSSREAEVFQLLQLQEVLYARRLYAQSQKVLVKASKLAKDFEMVRLLPEINFREQMLLLELESRQLPEKLKDQTYLHAKDVEALGRFWEAFSTHHQLLVNYREKAGKSSVEELPEWVELAEVGDGNFWVEYYRLSALSTVYRIKGELNRCHLVYGNLVEHWRKRPWAGMGKMKPSETRIQMKLLSNYLNFAFLVAKFSEFEKIRLELLEMESLGELGNDEKAELFQNVRFLELRLYLNTADFEKGNALIPLIGSELDRLKEKVNGSRRRAFYFNIGVFLFLQGLFSMKKSGEKGLDGLMSTAGYWFDRILEPPKTFVRKDLEIASMLLLSICHLEQDEYDPERGISALEALKRQLQSDRRLDTDFNRAEVDLEREAIRRLLRIFKKLSDPGEELLAQLKDFEHWCQNILSLPGMSGIQWVHPILYWISSQSQGIPISEVYFRETESYRKGVLNDSSEGDLADDSEE